MRIALGVSYEGQPWRGWQSQPSRQTVQDALEAALQRFATVPISTVCAGRTDAGVHGLMQVVHFDTDIDRPEFSWVRGPNRFLPPGIAVQWARRVPDAFHSRACATARRYAYVLLQSPVRPSIEAGRVGWVFQALDETAMREAAAHLVGEHDFTSFRAAECQARSPVKHLAQITITRRGAFEPAPTGSEGCPTGYWRFAFEGNAFLHHMIRNIMGCLIAVGQGTRPSDWMREVLQARSRSKAAPTFMADGLYFLGPRYDPAWGLPDRTAAYDWLP
ncbi:MAG: tRNA pseudouridine(38-40) synthase TruA [Comamonas sp. SCN 65-56]|uniref:tRNA pseudouridine(38-40) synthase TruA n=1 Tax=Comamonas sp. SCN 65-56 TaxID=1660095 RepID=UPI00086E8D82|nr:tRNA pseudouridine(38-40) synthase TruA [Comamonas sp. SCN 65-56]ODS92696.1 MAG: tRNA pseudouridine(38-40) synthase TruA [Comamonas sp. SCN 65-56]